MNLMAEVTIDLDQNRRVWSTASAEVEGIDDVPDDLFVKLSLSAAEGALRGYREAVERSGGRRPADVPQTFTGSNKKED